jgi:hypothetical protein
MRAATFKIRVSERWAHYRAQQAVWENELSERELKILLRQAEIIRARSELMRLTRLELLDPQDTHQLLDGGTEPDLDDDPEDVPEDDFPPPGMTAS